jgi:hypothetical protein
MGDAQLWSVEGIAVGNQYTGTGRATSVGAHTMGVLVWLLGVP